MGFTPYPAQFWVEINTMVIAGTDLRSGMNDFGPSCFHSASTGVRNANAAPEGGVQAFGNAKEFGCGDRI